jgi:hypothetical protein
MEQELGSLRADFTAMASDMRMMRASFTAENTRLEERVNELSATLSVSQDRIISLERNQDWSSHDQQVAARLLHLETVVTAAQWSRGAASK